MVGVWIVDFMGGVLTPGWILWVCGVVMLIPVAILLNRLPIVLNLDIILLNRMSILLSPGIILFNRLPILPNTRLFCPLGETEKIEKNPATAGFSPL